MNHWHDIEQNTEEWAELRMGRFTASMFGELMMGKATNGYDKAISKVAYERLTEEAPEFFSSAYMERGHELESLARHRYEMLTFHDVTNGGFFAMGEYVGASPDGLVDADGLLQVKCPAFNTMITYLRKKVLPKEYEWQLQGELYVTKRKWVDFFAFHPRLPEFIIRVEPDQEMQDRIELELNIAIKAVADIVSELKPLIK